MVRESGGRSSGGNRVSIHAVVGSMSFHKMSALATTRVSTKSGRTWSSAYRVAGRSSDAAAAASPVRRNINPSANAAPGDVASTFTAEPCITCPLAEAPGATRARARRFVPPVAVERVRFQTATDRRRREPVQLVVEARRVGVLHRPPVRAAADVRREQINIRSSRAEPGGAVPADPPPATCAPPRPAARDLPDRAAPWDGPGAGSGAEVAPSLSTTRRSASPTVRASAERGEAERGRRRARTLPAAGGVRVASRVGPPGVAADSASAISTVRRCAVPWQQPHGGERGGCALRLSSTSGNAAGWIAAQEHISPRPRALPLRAAATPSSAATVVASCSAPGTVQVRVG